MQSVRPEAKVLATSTNAPAGDQKVKRRVVITFGTYDLFHVGHLNIIERCKSYGDTLIVGVSSDALTYKKKTRVPVYDETMRMKIIGALRYVDRVFREDSLEEKRKYILEHNADILIMGNDWVGRFDEFKDICDVVYLDRTDGISTTDTIERIANNL
jgi:glycerol-3-phosphate cytidylyltransferase